MSWVFLLKEKSEVENVFKRFYHMVQTQFQTQIQMVGSDNGREYFTNKLTNFFEKKWDNSSKLLHRYTTTKWHS